MATPIFRVKRASSSQDTVDYIVQRQPARKNSSGNPGLSILTFSRTHTDEPLTTLLVSHIGGSQSLALMSQARFGAKRIRFTPARAERPAVGGRSHWLHPQTPPSK